MKQYDDVFKEQLMNGVIEQVKNQGVESDSKAHFLCHFGVARQERETTKLCVVFDGSAKANIDSLSLNDRSEVGANHMPLLFDTIIRFRLHSIAIIADIEKAFLQVQINESDRDMVRFLWFDDIGKENPAVVEYRYCRLVFGLTCSPSILAETIKHHVSQFPNEDSKILNVLDKLYCDDLSCGVDTREEAINLYKRCKEIMLKGGFNLRKWQSNDKVVQVAIDRLESLREATNNEIQGNSKSTLGVPNNIEGPNKVLGVIWDSDDDTLQLDLCDVAEFAKSLPATKRSVLRIAAKIFDPMGYLTVFTINFKVVFQRLCINKVPWDEPFTGEYMKKYESLLRLLEECPHVCMPRYLFSQGEQLSRIEIHSFSDASEKAFASVVYLRVEYLTGKVETKLIASKSKVAPVKQQSIPRLELLGACLMVKLVDNIVNVVQKEFSEHEIHKYYWVDSMTVLCWVTNSKPWVQYVRNRISEILSKSERHQWFYCPGSQNPADLPSRGKCSKLLANGLRWEGPEFLRQDSSSWSRNPSDSDLETEEALKERVRKEPVVTRALASSIDNDSIVNIGKTLDLSRFSCKGRLLRTVGRVKRLVTNLKASVRNEELNKDDELSMEEINDAEIVVIKSIQRESFYKEIDYLTNKTGAPPIYVSQFNLYLDEKDLLRCRTRIANASVSESCKMPLLLPSRSMYSELIIHDCHHKVLHNGARETLNLARQKYWVLRGREMAR